MQNICLKLAFKNYLINLDADVKSLKTVIYIRKLMQKTYMVSMYVHFAYGLTTIFLD